MRRLRSPKDGPYQGKGLRPSCGRTNPLTAAPVKYHQANGSITETSSLSTGMLSAGTCGINPPGCMYPTTMRMPVTSQTDAASDIAPVPVTIRSAPSTAAKPSTAQSPAVSAMRRRAPVANRRRPSTTSEATASAMPRTSPDNGTSSSPDSVTSFAKHCCANIRTS